MIQFEQVSYTYPGANKPVLNNVSLEIVEGALALLIGTSGVGKSTLLRCVNGLIPHFSGGELSGRLQVDGLDPVAASPQVMSRHVGFVFQNPEAQFVMDQVEDEIAFALENAALPPQEMRIRVEEVLDLLDLAPLRQRRLDTLSGGERQRVAIASALALRPNILVLDEPTSQLDPKSAEDVLQALARLNTDLGLTVFLTEHRLERVLPFTDHLLYLPDDGGEVLAGPPQSVLSELELGPPLVKLAKAWGWLPLPLTVKEGQRFSRRETRAAAVTILQETNPTSDEAAYLQADGLEVQLGGRPVLRGLDFQIRPGEIVAVMGRNGSGKTTLLKALVGLTRPQRGKIQLKGQETAGRDVAEISQDVGYLPQDPGSLLFAETVYDELLITLDNHGLSVETAPIAPDALLASLGLADKAAAYPRDLSVGEQQRAALAAIMVTKPGAVLLDEPTRGLDYQAKAQLIALLQQSQQTGMAVVLVTHDVELAAQVADRVVMLSQGEVIAAGSPGEVLGSSPLFAPQIAKLFPKTGWLTLQDALAAGR
jgi:energy-coupling factor transport system ATP-binding protein